MGEIVFGAILPHPPVLVPEVGGDRLLEIALTQNGTVEVARQLTASKPDTLIIISPHGNVGHSSVPVYTSHVFEGSLASFGQPKPVLSYKGDPELARAIIKQSGQAAHCIESLLDHGVMVPLYYCHKAGFKKNLLPIAVGFLPLTVLFEFGRTLAAVIKNSNRRVAVIASADLSHRLTQDAPAGYSPKGKIFDDKLVELLNSNDLQGLLNFDPVLADEAGQDALWSIAIMLGAVNAAPRVLSYEGPFGVGYLTAVCQPQ